MSDTYRISIEELAFAMGQASQPEVAGAFLQTLLGSQRDHQLEGRLLAASHALMARGLLKVDVVGKQTELEASFRGVIQDMLQSETSVRCSRSTRGVEQVRTYFRHGARLVEQELQEAVVAHLAVVEHVSALAGRAGQFFDLREKPLNGATLTPLAEVPSEVLDQAQRLVSEQAIGAVSDLFAQGGLPTHEARRLSQDFLNYEYRGSVLKVENQGQQLVSEQGFLILKGPERYWLFEPLPGEPALTRLYFGSWPVFAKMVNRLAP